MRLSRQDLIDLCELFKAKALEEHDRFRSWQARALEAESRLAIYEPGDGPPEDFRTWANRALLAQAQLATLKAAYEPAGMEPPC